MDMKYFTIFCLIGLSLALPQPQDPGLHEITHEIPKYEVKVNVITNFGFEKTPKEIQNIFLIKSICIDYFKA